MADGSAHDGLFTAGRVHHLFSSCSSPSSPFFFCLFVCGAVSASFGVARGGAAASSVAGREGPAARAANHAAPRRAFVAPVAAETVGDTQAPALRCQQKRDTDRGVGGHRPTDGLHSHERLPDGRACGRRGRTRGLATDRRSALAPLCFRSVRFWEQRDFRVPFSATTNN